ncbi:MAG TPA: DUF1326 domain-containing protein [Caulobacteraceae bacterium]|nr:DUF1326 domain-containing protein [Caulobacteraceae bacterium]
MFWHERARSNLKLPEAAMTAWEITGCELVNCTCEYGCNCQFGGLPDKGHCYAVAGIQIDEGHHGETRLDGLRVAAIFKWPAAIHEGNGEAIAFVDEHANDAQRNALLRIMSGEDTEPFATMFAVFASTVTKMNAPVFTKIDLEIDVDRRRGRLFVKDYIEMTGEPIRNPVSGAEARAQIVLPDGFEYIVAEIASASSKTSGPVQVEIADKYGQFARLHLNNHGVVRA